VSDVIAASVRRSGADTEDLAESRGLAAPAAAAQRLLQRHGRMRSYRKMITITRITNVRTSSSAMLSRCFR